MWPWRPGPRTRQLESGGPTPAEQVRVDDTGATLARFNLIGIADLQGLYRAMTRSSAQLRLYQPNASDARDTGLLGWTAGLALRWRVDGKWYALPCPRTGTPGWAHPDATAGPGPAGLAERIVYRLRVRRTDAEGLEKTTAFDLDTDIAVLADRSRWPDGGLLVTADAGGRIDECAAFLAAACFLPVLGPEHDSLETQHERFVDAHREAVARLTSGAVAASAITAERLARRVIAPAIPAGHTATVRVGSDGDTRVHIAPDAEPTR